MRLDPSGRPDAIWRQSFVQGSYAQLPSVPRNTNNSDPFHVPSAAVGSKLGFGIACHSPIELSVQLSRSELELELAQPAQTMPSAAPNTSVAIAFAMRRDFATIVPRPSVS